jgi:hypothetical protein
MTNEELNLFAASIQQLPCPICGSSTQKLNATIYGTALSVAVITFTNKFFLITCPSCLDKANKDATKSTRLIGWWGVPWGIIRTIQTLNLNKRERKQHHIGEANDILKSFVLNNESAIVNSKDNRQQMMELIRRQHALSPILYTWGLYRKQKATKI